MDSMKQQRESVTRRSLIASTAAGAVGGVLAGAAPAQTSAAGKVVYRAMSADMVQMRGHQNDLIDAYLARPTAPGKYPGVVVIHHMPGWDDSTIEITRRFAHAGYAAICPNLHFREGKATPAENSASVRTAGGMPDDRTMGDVDGAIRYLRALPYLNGKVGIIGYCSGGRQVYLAACTLKGIDAAVDCYGGGVGSGQTTPRQPVDPFTLTKNMSCPLLGLFGKEDKNPSPEAVAKMEAELKKWGKTYEFHAYDNTGHGFFSPDSPNYRQAAAVEGWKRIFEWYEKYLR
jgi:carboxymethylenebutenolidase